MEGNHGKEYYEILGVSKVLPEPPQNKAYVLLNNFIQNNKEADEMQFKEYGFEIMWK